MKTELNYLAHWLIDFELAATLILGAALLAMQWIRQPARRVALGWAVSVALTLVLAATALPAWPRWHALGQVSPASAAAGGTPVRAAETATFRTTGPTVQNAAMVSSETSHPESLSPARVVQGGTGGAFPLVPWLGRLFLLGVAVAGAWLIFGWVQAAWICRRARPAPLRLGEQLRAVAADQVNPPRLLLSAHLHNAVAVGILRPTILLPAGMAEQAPDPCLRAVLAHEMAHIRNHDLRLIGLWRCLLTVLFPQPLFWAVRHLIRASQEAVADAMASEGRPHDYADGLIGWMQQVVTPRRWLVAPAAGIGERPSELSKRIELLLDDQAPVHTSVSLRWRVGAAVVIGAVALGLSVVTVRPVLAASEAQIPPGPASATAPATSPASANTNGETFTGRVFDKTSHEPIPDAVVHVRQEIYSSTEHRLVQEIEHRTDGNGRFPFLVTPEVATNRYAYLDFEVTHSNYARMPWDGYSLSMIRQNQAAGARPFFEDLELTPAESISGTMVRPDGSPAAGVKILTYSKARKEDMAEYGSFAETLTDGTGAFEINVVKGGEAVLWLLPRDFAPSTRLLHQQRGNLGQFKLADGIRLSGQVFESDGTPAGSVWVNAELSGGPAKQHIGMPVADALRRSALTDGQGRFAMGPLPAGDYDLLTSEYPRDNLTEDHTYHAVPDTFVHQKFQLVPGQASASVELRAVPHVIVTIHQIDGQGRPHKSHEINASGRLNGNAWWGEGRPDDDGKIVLQVPRGLADARLGLMVNEHQSTRHRWSNDSPWSNEEEATVPILDQDYPEFSVIYYAAPVLLVKVVAADGSAVPGFKCQLEYAQGRKPSARPPNWISGATGDVNFEKQTDGRWRSQGLLPDENLELTVRADGFQPYSQSVNLPEGATREIVAQLQKQ
jgi:beta-lactamase regulating signal transducer with metallopeptidase domain